jgi:hypothetical protein
MDNTDFEITYDKIQKRILSKREEYLTKLISKINNLIVLAADEFKDRIIFEIPRGTVNNYVKDYYKARGFSVYTEDDRRHSPSCFNDVAYTTIKVMISWQF